MGLLSPPVRVGTHEPWILADTVVRWGPVSVLTARPTRPPRIIVEDATGITPSLLRAGRHPSEPRC